jgi:acetoin utilization protein AcuB
MHQYHIGAIPILNEQQKIEGIVTRGDLLRTLMNQAPLELWG